MDTSEKVSKSISSGMDTNRKIQLGLAAGLVVIAAGMYAWKETSVGKAEDKLAQAEAQYVQARAQLIEQASQLNSRHTQEALQRFSIPLAWAIRREVMAPNLDQVDQYFIELVQMEVFHSAILAQPDGKIVVASDRKQLAQTFTSIYPEQYLQERSSRIEQTADKKLRAIIPILGLNKPLGTLVLEYTPPVFSLK